MEVYGITIRKQPRMFYLISIFLKGAQIKLIIYSSFFQPTYWQPDMNKIIFLLSFGAQKNKVIVIEWFIGLHCTKAAFTVDEILLDSFCH